MLQHFTVVHPVESSHLHLCSVRLFLSLQSTAKRITCNAIVNALISFRSKLLVSPLDFFQCNQWSRWTKIKIFRFSVCEKWSYPCRSRMCLTCVNSCFIVFPFVNVGRTKILNLRDTPRLKSGVSCPFPYTQALCNIRLSRRDPVMNPI